MLYFIPAWYQQNEWCENEQYWYARRMRSEFDDTVKHIQLFHRSQAYPFRIMLLSFAPNFRHFLHRQSVFHAPYWSCFDAIQEIRRKKVVTFSFHNLNWPKDIEFIYSPYALVAQLHGERYAQVEFGEDGNPIQVDMYQSGHIQRKNIYDDRGFVSSTIVYEDGKPVRQDYLTDKGVWKMRHFFADGHVEINKKNPTYLLVHNEKEYKMTFVHTLYANMEQVIHEVLETYIELTDKEDIFCIAMHERHTSLLKEVLAKKKCILSFFENRYDAKSRPEALDMMERADYMIADSRENQFLIQGIVDEKITKSTNITPFDSRVDLGISQQLNVQKILVPVDGLEDDRFNELIKILGAYLPQNENAQVHLYTRNAGYDRKKYLLEKTRLALCEADLPEGWAAEGNPSGVTENMLDVVEVVPVKFFVEQCVSELAASKCIREQRLIVDMRSKTEVYLRISAISMGIPQIVYTETQFVENKKNGRVIKEIGKISEVLEFYLENLTNWNEAVVYSYELGKKYTTRNLIEKWKEVIEFVGSDSSVTTGE